MVKEKKSNIELLKSFIISWNNKFPYDKTFRKKYNIPFNSQKHRELSQIDIFIDIYEDRLMDIEYKKYTNRKKLLESYKETGEFLVDLDEKMSKEEKDDAFEKLMVGIKKMNDKKE